MKTILLRSLICIALIMSMVATTVVEAAVKTFTLNTLSRAYFSKTLYYVNGKKYYQVSNTEVTTATTFSSNKIALVIVDPWADSGSPQLNNHYASVFTNGVIPLVNKSVSLGINTIVMTNKYPQMGYDGPINPTLQQLVNQGKVWKLYHEDWSPYKFASSLKAQGITSVFVAGFASNMCVIGRADTGLIALQGQGLKLYFIPDASAAIEFDDWNSTPGPVHEATTLLISQWMAELIKLSDFLAIQ